jgi:hypothetical protein
MKFNLFLISILTICIASIATLPERSTASCAARWYSGKWSCAMNNRSQINLDFFPTDGCIIGVSGKLNGVLVDMSIEKSNYDNSISFLDGGRNRFVLKLQPSSSGNLKQAIGTATIENQTLPLICSQTIGADLPKPLEPTDPQPPVILNPSPSTKVKPKLDRSKFCVSCPPSKNPIIGK